MAKELPYFRFTVAEWLQDDISLEDYETKGVFSDICAWYWFKDCSINLAMLEKKFSNALPQIRSLVQNDILKTDASGNISINFLDEQYDLLSEKRQKRVKAGRMGGKQKSSNAKAMLKQNASYKDKDNNKDNNKDNKFITPTIEQVKVYCLERRNNVDAEKFVDFYNSKGWMVGKNKMKDWQASVRTWEKEARTPQAKDSRRILDSYKGDPDLLKL